MAFNGKEPVGHPSVPEPFRSIGPIDGSFAPISDVPTFPESVSGGNKTGWLYTRGIDHFLNYTDENNRDLLPDAMKQTYSYRTKNWRYILYIDGTEELYYHRNDPYEWDNLANENNIVTIKQELRKSMFEIINGSN